MPHGNWPHRTIARVVHQGRFAGNAFVNVFHFEATPAAETANAADAAMQENLQELLLAWTTEVIDDWSPMMLPSYSLLGLTGQILERPNQLSHALTAVDYTTGYPKPGTNPFPDVGALSAAAVVKWRSLIAGKSHRGRTYIGPLGENDMTSGLVAGNFPARCQTWINAVINTFGPTGSNPDWRLTIYSRPYNQFAYGYVKGKGPARDWFWPTDYNGNSSNVLSGSLDLTIRSQRRRELGVGA